MGVGGVTGEQGLGNYLVIDVGVLKGMRWLGVFNMCVGLPCPF